ncbi:MAG: class I SAM-dependent methyltransferase [Candidatus Eremiobacteraeota bacterium]|nr:class I SAM-dependent methyltransferase [Candidatus Eremiobacteraeota bacterium]
MSRSSLGLESRLYDYMLAVSLREPPVMTALRNETGNMPQASMQISPEQGQFMALLIELLGLKEVLEVGTFTGYSALAMARALPEDGRLVACDVSEEWTTIARRYWHEAGVAQKIDLRLGPALETMQTLRANGRRFDLVFIDADKANYRNYYEVALELLPAGGLVVVDNVLWSGRVVEPGVNDPDTVAIRSFNRFVHSDERVGLSLLPVGDGLLLARKRAT